MVKLDIAFVILHYLNITDTIETIYSVEENIDSDSVRIVVVDNASPDGSGEVLAKEFENDEKVVVILNQENLGFSAGNNVGIRYLRENYTPKYIVLSNNDVYLYDTHMFQKIEKEYQTSSFAVMGPMILTADGRCDSNPQADIPYTREECLAEISLYEKHIKRASRGTYKLWAKYDYYMRKLSCRYNLAHQSPVHKDRTKGIFLHRRENVVLHGCFMILSETYFSHFDGLDVRTFMYSEENILYVHLKNKNLKEVYNPEIVIYHKEGASVNLAYSGGIDAKVFRFQKKIEAHRGYLSLLDELSGCS